MEEFTFPRLNEYQIPNLSDITLDSYFSWETLGINSSQDISLLGHPEILISNILPRLSLRDLVTICQVNRTARDLCDDKDVWKNKIYLRYNITSGPRNLTWKSYYFDLVSNEFTHKLSILFNGPPGIMQNLTPVSVPFVQSNMMQQLYDIGDTLIVPFSTTYRMLFDEIYNIASPYLTQYWPEEFEMSYIEFLFTNDDRSVQFRIRYFHNGEIYGSAKLENIDFLKFTKVLVPGHIYERLPFGQGTFALSGLSPYYIREEMLDQPIININMLADII